MRPTKSFVCFSTAEACECPGSQDLGSLGPNFHGLDSLAREESAPADPRLIPCTNTSFFSVLCLHTHVF